MKFAHPKGIAQTFDNSPAKCVDLLSDIMTQEQCDAFEAELFPEPCDEEKIAVFESVRLTLKGIRCAEDSTEMAAIDAAIAKLAPKAELKL